MNVHRIIFLICASSSAIGYEFKCPDNSQRSQRAELMCGEKFFAYTCLKDIINERYVEGCYGPMSFPYGHKCIISGNLDIEDCDREHYQPIIFLTSQQSDCIYKKSKCTEEGQSLKDIGTTKTDKLCSCDRQRGYTFLETGLTYCMPSESDCTCLPDRYNETDFNRSNRIKRESISEKIGKTMSAYRYNNETIKIVGGVKKKGKNLLTFLVVLAILYNILSMSLLVWKLEIKLETKVIWSKAYNNNSQIKHLSHLKTAQNDPINIALEKDYKDIPMRYALQTLKSDINVSENDKAIQDTEKCDQNLNKRANVSVCSFQGNDVSEKNSVDAAEIKDMVGDNIPSSRVTQSNADFYKVSTDSSWAYDCADTELEEYDSSNVVNDVYDITDVARDVNDKTDEAWEVYYKINAAWEYDVTDEDLEEYGSTNAVYDVYDITDVACDVYDKTDEAWEVYDKTDAAWERCYRTDAVWEVYDRTGAAWEVYVKTYDTRDVYDRTDAAWEEYDNRLYESRLAAKNDESQNNTCIDCLGFAKCKMDNNKNGYSIQNIHHSKEMLNEKEENDQNSRTTEGNLSVHGVMNKDQFVQSLENLLHTAYDSDHEKIMKNLEQNWVNVKQCDLTGRSLLHFTCYFSSMAMLNILIKTKANVNQCDLLGVSPLHISCCVGGIELVRILIQNKANVNNLDTSGKSPLFYACDNGHSNIVQILIENNADFSKCCNLERVALYEKIGFSTVFRMPKNNQRSRKVFNDTDLLNYLRSYRRRIAQYNEEQKYLLYRACQKGYIDIIKILLSVEGFEYIASYSESKQKQLERLMMTSRFENNSNGSIEPITWFFLSMAHSYKYIFVREDLTFQHPCFFGRQKKLSGRSTSLISPLKVCTESDKSGLVAFSKLPGCLDETINTFHHKKSIVWSTLIPSLNFTQLEAVLRAREFDLCTQILLRHNNQNNIRKKDKCSIPKMSDTSYYPVCKRVMKAEKCLFFSGIPSFSRVFSQNQQNIFLHVINHFA